MFRNRQEIHRRSSARLKMSHTFFLFQLCSLLLHFCYAFSTPSNKPIPITVISGFLGSGKTTLLKNLLENKKGIKIAVIVNDVASVNIDSKLVSAGSDGMVQLQNGCACCSLADELLGRYVILCYNTLLCRGALVYSKSHLCCIFRWPT